jgi:hypothetical protein
MSLQENIDFAKIDVFQWVVMFILAAIGFIWLISVVGAASDAWGGSVDLFDGVGAVLMSLGLTAAAGGIPAGVYLLWSSSAVLARVMLAIWAPIALGQMIAPVWAWIDDVPQVVSVHTTPVPTPVAETLRSRSAVERELSSAIAKVPNDDWGRSHGCKEGYTSVTGVDYGWTAPLCYPVLKLRKELDRIQGTAVPALVTASETSEIVTATMSHRRSLAHVLFLRIAMLGTPTVATAIVLAWLAWLEVNQPKAPAKAAGPAPTAPNIPLQGSGNADAAAQIRGWFRKHIQIETGGTAKMVDMYQDYVGWCKSGGVKHLGPMEFTDEMKALSSQVRGMSIDLTNGVCQGARLGAI